MAFKMNRPVIKGTPLHAASIAKATSESIVAQTRTQADGSLVGAGQALGKSYIPATIDYSVDLKAIKIPKKKKKKKEKIEVQDPTGNTESADSKYVAPYVDEAEDEDNDYSGIENDNSGTTDDSTSAENKPYKNWKVRENEKNIKEAKANKKKQDETSAKRVAEAKKNNTNMDFTTKNPDIVMPGDKTFKPNPKSDIRVKNKEELDAAQEKTINRDALITQEEAGAATGNKGEGKLVKKTKKELAIEAEVKAKTAETLRIENERQSKLKADKIAADKAKQEKIAQKKAKKDEINLKNEAIRERNAARNYFKGKTNQPKSIDDKVAAMREIKAAQQAALNNDSIYIPEQDDLEPWEIATQNQKNLNYNTPQNQVTQTNTEQTLTPRQARKKKLADKKYNDPNTGPKVKEQMIKEGYNPIQSKSPAQMRDDRIYRNARADGPVRKNMIKSGYTPQ